MDNSTITLVISAANGVAAFTLTALKIKDRLRDRRPKA